jgi:DNA-binding LacI/PurR family transcriptional regulator
VGSASRRTGMIGLTLPLVADAYFGPMLSGAAGGAYESDMRIVLAPTLHESYDREVLAPRTVDVRHDRRCDPDAALRSPPRSC